MQENESNGRMKVKESFLLGKEKKNLYFYHKLYHGENGTLHLTHPEGAVGSRHTQPVGWWGETGVPGEKLVCLEEIGVSHAPARIQNRTFLL